MEWEMATWHAVDLNVDNMDLKKPWHSELHYKQRVLNRTREVTDISNVSCSALWHCLEASPPWELDFRSS